MPGQTDQRLSVSTTGGTSDSDDLEGWAVEPQSLVLDRRRHAIADGDMAAQVTGGGGPRALRPTRPDDAVACSLLIARGLSATYRMHVLQLNVMGNSVAAGGRCPQP